jgi:catechol 2,3-dioxygenase-like lactoylglutathione lyase family enzyme
VVVAADIEASLRFYRDGIGLDVLRDLQVDGDWPELFGAPSRRLRAVFLGDATLGRLAALSLGGPPRSLSQATPRGTVTLATVRDPDGVLVLLTPDSITRAP